MSDIKLNSRLNKILKLLGIGCCLTILSGIAYTFGLMITGLFLGDYFKAVEVTEDYSLIYKIILSILTGATLIITSVILRVIYHFVQMIYDDNFDNIHNLPQQETNNKSLTLSNLNTFSWNVDRKMQNLVDNLNTNVREGRKTL